ncbi:hypothetical protein SAMN05428981_1126 [Bacillus sp. OV194]|nr:hypothetical protein SAMN05428981_1126 [Bacillus sp. OV194]
MSFDGLINLFKKDTINNIIGYLWVIIVNYLTLSSLINVLTKLGIASDLLDNIPENILDYNKLIISQVETWYKVCLIIGGLLFVVGLLLLPLTEIPFFESVYKVDAAPIGIVFGSWLFVYGFLPGIYFGFPNLFCFFPVIWLIICKISEPIRNKIKGTVNY